LLLGRTQDTTGRGELCSLAGVSWQSKI